MSVNFNSGYQAWQGMVPAATANRQAKLSEEEFEHQKMQDSIAKARNDKEFAETKKNNILARAYKQAQIDEINKNLGLDQSYNKSLSDKLNSTSANPVVVNGQISATGIDNINSLMSFQSSTGDWATDNNINTETGNIVKNEFANIKNNFIGKSKEEIEAWLQSNETEATGLYKLVNNSGLFSSGNLVEELYTDKGIVDENSLQSSLPQDYGFNSKWHTYDDGTGNNSDSSIKYSGSDSSNREDANVLLKAMQGNLNIADENFFDTSNLRLKDTNKTDADGNQLFQLQEADTFTWSNFDARVNKDNVAQVKINGKWIKLNSKEADLEWAK